MAVTLKDTVVSVRFEAELIEQLDDLAGEMDRSRSYLIGQAVREYVEREYASLTHIREGEREADAGMLIPHEEVDRWLADMADGKRRPAPRAKK